MRTTNEKQFSYKGEPFITEAVKTAPYVWHLTRKSNRLKIALEGILPIRGLVFANNVNESIGPMWHWDTEMECLDGNHLDYWRIDVRTAGVRWYNDTNLDYMKAWGRYVCTPSPIPVEALTLFRHDESLKFKPSKYDEYGEERDWVSHCYAIQELKGNYEKIYVKRTEGVASCSLRQLPLKRVDPIVLLAEDIEKDKANSNLAFNVLPILFEERPEQTAAAIAIKGFESFYETLFQNRKTIGSKDDWERLFRALTVNDNSHQRGCDEGRFHQVSLYSFRKAHYADPDIFITLPCKDAEVYRFFRRVWSKSLNSFLMEEYICGAYHDRTNLKFQAPFYCPEALDKFLLENPIRN